MHFGGKICPQTYLSEETIQELFLHLYERQTDLKQIQNLKAYLYIAFRRSLLTRLKKIKSSTSVQLTDIHFTREEFLNPQSSEEESRQLIEHLNGLPWRQREALYLRYFNHLSSKEIADIMGIQAQVVSNMIYKALKKLKSIYPPQSNIA